MIGAATIFPPRRNLLRNKKENVLFGSFAIFQDYVVHKSWFSLII